MQSTAQSLIREMSPQEFSECRSWSHKMIWNGESRDCWSAVSEGFLVGVESTQNQGSRARGRESGRKPLSIRISSCLGPNTEYPGGQGFEGNGSTPRRAEYTFAHYHNEAVVRAVLACAVVLRTLHFRAKEVCGGVVAGGIYVVVLVVVAHFDPIGMGIEMGTSCNSESSIGFNGNG